MALQGPIIFSASGVSSSYNDYTYAFLVTHDSYDASTNKSQVTVKAYILCPNSAVSGASDSTRIFYDISCTAGCTINNQSIGKTGYYTCYYKTSTSSLPSSPLWSETVTLAHDASTKKLTIDISGSFTHSSSRGWMPPVLSITGELTFDNPVTYTLTVNGGTGGGTYAKGQTANITATSKTGYLFTGWSGGSTSRDSSTTVTVNGDLTCTANYRPYKLTVNYYGNGATSGTWRTENISNPGGLITDAQSVFEYDGSNNDLNNVQNPEYLYLSRRGYTPTGYWTTSSDGSGYKVHQLTSYTIPNLAKALGVDISSGDRSVNVYAEWTPKKIKLTLNPNGGSGGTQYVWFYYGEHKFYSNESCTAEITSIVKPTKPGYGFIHYYGDGTSGGEPGERYAATDDYEFAGDLVTDIYQDATLYALWEALATMIVKADTAWLAGEPFIKLPTGWVKATGVFVKTAGGWKQSTR